MKNKMVTYLLIAGVAAVWGIIFYRVYISVVDDAPSPLVSITPKKASFNEVNHDTANLVLALNYRDPFSEIDYAEAVENKSQSVAVKPVTAAPIKKPIDWTGIQYKGYITNPSTKQKVAIMQVLGAETMITEGQEINGLKLVRFSTDSVLVKYQQVLKFIKLK